MLKPEPEPEPEPEPDDGVFAIERIEAEEQMQHLEQYAERAVKADASRQEAALELEQARHRLDDAQRRLKRAQAEQLRRAAKRPPPRPR
eukprot:7386252-Prymnesium_polylepis.2